MEEEKEEVVAEVEAVRAVYGDDCRVILEFPPYLAVHIRPRTADISSQQFVEVVLGIEANAQYPKDPPCINIVDSKGLDEKREEHLTTSIRAKSQELSSCSMLVALCEEAVEILSSMNFPEGSCPLCLYPLFSEDSQKLALPFMKLMSCFHCFHCGCISRWWKWLQEQNTCTEHKKGIVDQQLGNCPVCRKKFDAKDIEHVVGLVEANSTPLSHEELDLEDEKEFLQSDIEKSRRQKFEVLKEIQKKSSGLIESKKAIPIIPGMFLPESQIPLATVIEMPVDSSEEFVSDLAPETGPRVSSRTATTSLHKNSNYRRNRPHHPRRERNSQASKRWIQKEGSSYK